MTSAAGSLADNQPTFDPTHVDIGPVNPEVCGLSFCSGNGEMKFASDWFIGCDMTSAAGSLANNQPTVELTHWTSEP